MTAQIDLTRFLRPGDRITWGQASAEPMTLIRHLIAQRHSLNRVHVFLGIGLAGQLQPEHADAIGFLAYGGSGPTGRLNKAGGLDVLPVHYSQLPHLIRSGALKIDAVMVQVSPPDAAGRHSLGMAREYLPEALAQARVVLGEVHPDVPWTHGGPYLTAGDFDLLIEAEDGLPAAPPAKSDPVSDAIGQNVAAMIEDGMTLQTGIGSIPDAVMAQLGDRRDLGIHSGSIGDGVARLQEAGVITNSRKPIDAGVTVGGVLIGGDALRRFAHRNPGLELRATDHTHGAATLGRLDRFVALNSAVEVDLTGQVNSEVAAGRYVGAVGGIVDFLRAAGANPGGLPIVALPSTAGRHSRIVARLSGPVTVPRSDAGVIVTEFGRADLRGLSLRERIPKMIGLAHPDHREALERAAHEADALS